MTTAPAPTTTGVVPTGFGTVAGRVTAADGSTCDVCLWAASTAAEQARGLMGVTDLGGADGMVFRFASPVATQFFVTEKRPVYVTRDGKGQVIRDLFA